MRRGLTPGEGALVRAAFGDAVDLAAVSVNRAKWAFFQPANTVMAPDGALWFHPASDAWRDDFTDAPIDLQGLFVHEMTHVWQAQRSGRWWLPLMRHPFCRYAYAFAPDRPFDRYGIEQQAELVRHAFLQRRGRLVPGAPPLDALEQVIPFTPL